MIVCWGAAGSPAVRVRRSLRKPEFLTFYHFVLRNITTYYHTPAQTRGEGGNGDPSFLSQLGAVSSEAVPFIVSRPKAGGILRSPRGRPARTAPHFFSRKEMGERKGGEGNFSFPSPLPSKRAAFLGAAPDWQGTTLSG